MSEEREGNVVWSFDAGWHHSKYDEWAFYRSQYNGCADGTKAVDIIAIDAGGQTTWLIEAKDYRRARRDPTKAPLPLEVARKVHDTLAGLVAAAVNAPDDHEQDFARKAIDARRLRVVLHLEQATRPSKMFPHSVDAADIAQKLRQLVRAIDPHPLVMSSTRDTAPWETRWDPP